MAELDEFDLDIVDEDIDKKNKVEKRIKDLSDKVRITSEERDELKGLLVESEKAKEAAFKERDFHSSFADATAKYPGANEYKDTIKDKVLSGYSVEDATVAVLASEGKLVMPEPAAEPEPSPAGGSAVNQPPAGEKKLDEMTLEEKREAVLEAERKGEITT